MQLENQTVMSAAIARVSLPYRDLTMATVVLKASYEVTAGGRAQLLAEQLPVNEDDVNTPFGAIDGDVSPVKDGCDLAVMGSACAPGARATESMEVALSLGKWQRRLSVFGDRIWQGKVGNLRPSSPQPFVELPLTYARAFGGLSSTGEDETGYDDNPEGRGFVFLEQHAAGALLPNLEESDQLLRTWQDRPLPAGVAPLSRQSALRVARSVHVDLEAGVSQVKPAMFSWSHPRMRLERYLSGEWLHVAGMRADGDWSFALPELRAALTVSLGDRSEVLVLRPDTIVAFPSFGRFFVLARCAFVYQFIARRERHARLTLLDDSANVASPSSLAERIAMGDKSLLQPAAEDSPIPFELLRELYPLRNIVESLPLVLSG